MNEIIHKIKGYLGCEVPLWCSENILYHDKVINLDELMDNLRISNVCKAINKGDIKLKLRKLDSLTDDQLLRITYLIDKGGNICKKRNSSLAFIRYYINMQELNQKTLEYFNKHHIDYQDLIVQGLAVEVKWQNKKKIKFTICKIENEY